MFIIWWELLSHARVTERDERFVCWTRKPHIMQPTVCLKSDWHASWKSIAHELCAKRICGTKHQPRAPTTLTLYGEYIICCFCCLIRLFSISTLAFAIKAGVCWSWPHPHSTWWPSQPLLLHKFILSHSTFWSPTCHSRDDDWSHSERRRRLNQRWATTPLLAACVCVSWTPTSASRHAQSRLNTLRVINIIRFLFSSQICISMTMIRWRRLTPLPLPAHAHPTGNHPACRRQLYKENVRAFSKRMCRRRTSEASSLVISRGAKSRDSCVRKMR